MGASRGPVALVPRGAATLQERSGLRLTAGQVDTRHQRTGGWAAGLRVAALAVARTADRDVFSTSSAATKARSPTTWWGEILSRLPQDIQGFLRVISISDPVPCGLAAELSGQEEAGSLLDGLERQTSLLSATGPTACRQTRHPGIHQLRQERRIVARQARHLTTGANVDLVAVGRDPCYPGSAADVGAGHGIWGLTAGTLEAARAGVSSR